MLPSPLTALKAAGSVQGDSGAVVAWPLPHPFSREQARALLIALPVPLPCRLPSPVRVADRRRQDLPRGSARAASEKPLPAAADAECCWLSAGLHDLPAAAAMPAAAPGLLPRPWLPAVFGLSKLPGLLAGNIGGTDGSGLTAGVPPSRARRFLR